MIDRLSATRPGKLFADRLRIARLVPAAGRGLVTGLALVNIVLGALPVLFVVGTGVVLGRIPAAVRGGLTSPAWHSLAGVFAMAAVAFVAQQILAPLANSLGELVTRRIDGQEFAELMRATLHSPGIAPLEDQPTLDELSTAARELELRGQSPGSASAGLLALIARYTQLAGYLVVVGVAFAWPAAAGLLIAVVLFRYGQRGGLRKYSRVWVDDAASARVRKSDYLRELSVEPHAGKEIRVFGLAGWLRDAARAAYLDVLRPVWAERRRIYLWPFVFFAGWGLVVAAVVFGLIGARAASTPALTGFALVVQAVLGALRLADFYPEADVQTAFGMLGHEATGAFTARVRAFPGPVVPPNRLRVPDPAGTIHFDRVGFRYPGQSRMILDDLDLRIPVGKCTAIVGANGTGKTTLIKLLARLYEPADGAIRVDGVDVRDYPIDAWRAKLAVIFQEFAHYEISAADNIAFGAVGYADDREGIRRAAAAAGIDDALERLPGGLDTPLTRQVAGGAELSGGQWQRVALARALFALRHGRPILVLDEPTASLDVRAEARFFAEFVRLTAGATTLLISHRFSTVQHADVIVVLERGRVVEQGSHPELLALDGRYAQLFRLQAQRFTDGAAV